MQTAKEATMTSPGNRGRRALTAGFGLALLLCGGTAARAQDAVLLTTTVPGYVPGMVVGMGERLMLPDGSSATILFRTGEVLRLHGPFDGPLALSPGGNPAGAVASLAAAFRLQGVDAAVIGGTRTATVSGRHHHELDEVVIDPQRAGTYCMQASASIWILRPTGDVARYELRRKGTTRALTWPGDAERIEWPDGMPIEDHDRYEVLVDGTPRATVTFRTMDDQAANAGEWIADGMLRGCGQQFATPLRRLARSLAPPELYLTSNHGRTPSYHEGDPVQLTVEADSDGYLYCVNVRNGHTTVPVFPAGAFNGAQVHAAVPVAIPGHRSQTTIWAATKGAEEVHCWLVDRDISPELPKAVLAVPAAPLPDQIAGDLDSFFAGIGGSQIAHATLRINVE
jgi:hypothetical protein